VLPHENKHIATHTDSKGWHYLESYFSLFQSVNLSSRFIESMSGTKFCLNWNYYTRKSSISFTASPNCFRACQYFLAYSMIQINLDDPPSSDVQRKIVVRVFQKFSPVSNLIKFKWLVRTTLKWLPATPPQSKIVGGVHSITCWVLTRGSQWCCQ